MSARDVVGGVTGEDSHLVELHKSEHPQNVEEKPMEEHIKDKQEQRDPPSYKTKLHSNSISTYLAIFQWILVIFCVLSNIYLLTKPSVKCECEELNTNAQNQIISIIPTTDSPTKQPTTSPETTTSLLSTSHPSAHTSVDPTVFPSTQPTLKPTIVPSLDPTVAPTVAPTSRPSSDPSTEPTKQPTKGPTTHPSLSPSNYPSQSPTYFDGYFVGDYKYSFRDTSHGFWLLCHGQWLDITQYSLLYDVMGYKFGIYYNSSSDTSYFRVPDARDTIVGVIGSVHEMGQHIGSETYKLSESEMPQHAHYFVGDYSHDSCGSGSGVYITRSCDDVASTTSNAYDFEKTAVFQTEFQTSARGSNQSFSLMQPTKFIGNLFVYVGEIL